MTDTTRVWPPTDQRWVDQFGFEHWHEVPILGQFRLKSACEGCDEVADELGLED